MADEDGVVFTVNTAGAKGKTFLTELTYRDQTDEAATGPEEKPG